MFKQDAFEIEATKVWLADRFATTDTRAAGNTTKRVDKYSSCFNALMKKITYRKWSEVLTNLDDILATHYKTDSTRQSILSMLRVLCVDYAGMPSDAWTMKYAKKNADLKQSYKEAATEKELVGMSFKDAKAFVTDKPIISLYLKLMCGDMPVCRLGDFVNASTIDDGKNNYIDVKKKTMLRRITKNTKPVGDEGYRPPMTLKLPKVIIDEIKKQAITGKLFGDLDEHKISYMVKKGIPDVNANSRHFRNLYSTQKIIKMRSATKMEEALKVMDHNLQTWLQIYQKLDTPILKLMKTLVQKKKE